MIIYPAKSRNIWFFMIEKIRCFIAINFPDWFKEEVEEILMKLKKANPRLDVRWVRASNSHLTLHFLGYLDKEKLDEVKRVLSYIIPQTPLISLRLEGFNYFPSPQRPRVFFIELKEDKGVLVSCQKRIGQELEKIGIRTEKRPWRSHLTLARLGISRPLKMPSFDFSKTNPIPVRSIELMKSRLFPQGPQYTIIQSFPLKG